jgi:hypothetical protein
MVTESDVPVRPQMKRLLQPLQRQAPCSSGGPPLCLLDFLSSVVPLRDSMVRLLLDKMVECCSPEGLMQQLRAPDADSAGAAPSRLTHGRPAHAGELLMAGCMLE